MSLSTLVLHTRCTCKRLSGQGSRTDPAHMTRCEERIWLDERLDHVRTCVVPEAIIGTFAQRHNACQAQAPSLSTLLAVTMLAV
jgi:hypothetical protein